MTFRHAVSLLAPFNGYRDVNPQRVALLRQSRFRLCPRGDKTENRDFLNVYRLIFRILEAGHIFLTMLV
jgi:hypothetical protein